MGRVMLLMAFTSILILQGCRTSNINQELKEATLNQDHGVKITKELLTDKSFTG